MRVRIERNADGRVDWTDTNDGYVQIKLVLVYPDATAPQGQRVMRGELCWEAPNGDPSDADIVAIVRAHYPRAEVVVAD